MSKFFKYISVLLWLPLLYTCAGITKKDVPEPDKKETDVTRIIKSGALKVVLGYSSTNYFIYKGQPMGFEYEILQHLAKDMRVTLDITVKNNDSEVFQDLYDKKYDLLAKGTTITKSKSELIEFTSPINQTRQVLVQRKPQGWRSMTLSNIEKILLRNQLDLSGKQVYVQSGSAQHVRLQNLSDEIGADIDIVCDSIFGVERLIEMVANGEIDYTVCYEDVAKASNRYYPDLDIQTPVSFPQNQAWVVCTDSHEWLDYINNWIVNFRKSATFQILYRKYFDSSSIGTRFNSDYHSYTDGKLSPFDDLIKKIAKEADIDWLLVAAIICRESDYDPNAESWRGARGLMQILPESAEMFNITNYLEPENNIKTGVRLLQWLDNQFKAEITDSLERVKFVLASYNCGIGHVQDAQRLAEKYGKQPTVWANNVDYFLLNKSTTVKYFKDPIVRSGYCRGNEPFQFVNKVMSTYRHYQNILTGNPE